MVPFTYDASTPCERVEEDCVIRERTAIGADAFSAQYQAIRSWPGTIDRLGTLAMPVLVIHGETDRLVPPENGHILARAIPQSKLVMIPNASHIFFTDQPEASKDAILSFLAGIVEPGPRDDPALRIYNREMRYIALAALLALVPAAPASAQIDARMFRHPAVSDDKIAFVYAGDIWLVPKKGGTAVAAELAAGRGVVPAVLAGRHEDRLQRGVRRQRGRLRRVRRRRRADAPHVSPDGRSRHRLAPGRQARAVRLRTRERTSAVQPVLSRRPRRRPARESCRCRTASSATFSPDGGAVRLHADVAGLPQLEALPRRLGAGPVAVRSEDVRREEHHQQSGQRRAADVARRHDLLPLRSRRRASATTSGRRICGTGACVRSRSSTTSTSRSRRSVPTRSCFRQAAGSTFSIWPTEKTTEVPVRVVTDETTLRPRTAKAEALIECASVSPTRQARRLRGARRRRHRAGGKRRGHQRHPHRPASPSVTRAGRPTERRSPTGAIAAASTS